MTDSPVRWTTDAGALVITIDNPPVNVISRSVRSGLIDAIAAAEAAIAEGKIGRVIITGAGRTFVAGADAKEFDGVPVEPHLPDVLNRLAALPAIAAINGAALGGGLEIALACRARVAAPKAVLGLPEVNLGVVPGAGGTQRLPRLIGIANAMPLIAEGRSVKPPEALTLGIIDEIADDPVAAALALGDALLGRPAIDDLAAPTPAPEAGDAARDHRYGSGCRWRNHGRCDRLCVDRGGHQGFPSRE
jgi:3-hydroxyacyl-CoA dehydrogenase